MSGIKGPCINLDPDYFQHPKTLRLVHALGKGSEALPIKLWCHCAKHHAKDGRLAGYSAREIEAVVGWWGTAGHAVRTLLQVGYLEREEDGTFRIHDWEAYEGHIFAMHLKGQQMARARWDKLKGKDAVSIAPAMPEQCSSNAPSFLPSGLPSSQANPLNPPLGGRTKAKTTCPHCRQDVPVLELVTHEASCRR